MFSGTAIGDYETDSLNNGPQHQIIPGLYLGTSIDYEFTGQSSSLADGDGLDEDGIVFPTTMQIIPGGTLNIPLIVTNTTGEIAYLKMWIDWNGDGDFDDPNEMTADLDDSSSAFLNYIPVNIPEHAVQDQKIGVRIRLSNEDDMTPYGIVSSGEVEDYLIQINCSNACLNISTQKSSDD